MINANKIHYNSIPDQQLTHNNELTIKNWNDYINQLRTQTNNITTWIKQLCKWIDDLHVDSKQDKLTSANAGVGITITNENGLLKISADQQMFNMNNYVDTLSLIAFDNKIELYGFGSAVDHSVPFKINGVLKWEIIPDLTTIQTIASNAQSSALSASQSAYNAAVSATEAEQIKNSINAKFWFGSIEEYNSLSHIDQGIIYIIHS